MKKSNNLSRFLFINATIAIIASNIAAQTKQPNIILILADDMSFECIVAIW